VEGEKNTDMGARSSRGSWEQEVRTKDLLVRKNLGGSSGGGKVVLAQRSRCFGVSGQRCEIRQVAREHRPDREKADLDRLQRRWESMRGGARESCKIRGEVVLGTDLGIQSPGGEREITPMGDLGEGEK